MASWHSGIDLKSWSRGHCSPLLRNLAGLLDNATGAELGLTYCIGFSWCLIGSNKGFAIPFPGDFKLSLLISASASFPHVEIPHKNMIRSHKNDTGRGEERRERAATGERFFLTLRFGRAASREGERNLYCRGIFCKVTVLGGVSW